MNRLTVFISTFNRTDTLTSCIGCLRRQAFPATIVIVDNGSRADSAVACLAELEQTYTVYRMPAIEELPVLPGDLEAHGGHAMQAVQRNMTAAFQAELEAGNTSEWFGMTDADVWLDGSIYSLDTYMYLAKNLGRSVGPHLRLNVHDNYPLRSAALILNARVLFRSHMRRYADLHWSPDDIDSTFHLFPATDTFRRLEMDTARVGTSYMATHSDWCLDFLKPTTENHEYILGSGEAASWGGRWIRHFFREWLRSPESAFGWAENAYKERDDYVWSQFILSWMLQYGHGCEVDLERSRWHLRNSFPDWSPCWEYEQHWDAIVYDNDHSCLGW